MLDTSIAVAPVEEPAVALTKYPLKSVFGVVQLNVTVVEPPFARLIAWLVVYTVSASCLMVKFTFPL